MKLGGMLTYLPSRQKYDAVNHEKKVNKLLKLITAAERKGDWDAYEKLTIEVETLEANAINTDAGQLVMPVYLSIKTQAILDASNNNGLVFKVKCPTL